MMSNRSLSVFAPSMVLVAVSSLLACGGPKLIFGVEDGPDAASPTDMGGEIVVPEPRCDETVAMTFDNAANLIEYTVLEGYQPTTIEAVTDCSIFGLLTGADGSASQPFVASSLDGALSLVAITADEGEAFDQGGVLSIAAPHTGNWFAYLSSSTNVGGANSLDAGTKAIFVYDRGKEVHIRASEPIEEDGVIAGPAASRDGTWLYYGVSTPGGGSTLFRYDVWNRKATSLGTLSNLLGRDVSFNGALALSDDATTLVATVDNEIAVFVVADVDGNLESNVAARFLPNSGGGGSLTISQNNRYILFESTAPINERDSNTASDLYILDRDPRQSENLDDRTQSSPIIPERIETFPAAGTSGSGISSDGRFVPFLAQGSLITFWPKVSCSCGESEPPCGADDESICGPIGTCVAELFCDYSLEEAEKWNLYVYNIQTEEIALLSSSDAAGGISDGNCTDVAISASGEFVYATCASSNLTEESPSPVESRLYSVRNVLF